MPLLPLPLIRKSPVRVPPEIGRKLELLGILRLGARAEASEERDVTPVPPLVTGSVPVTPGVIFAVPLKLAVDVDPRFVRIVLAVASFVAAVAVPPEARAPTSAAVGVQVSGRAPIISAV